jgi:hypothetical protein
MKWAPKGCGGERRTVEQVKRDGWHEHGILAIDEQDRRLSWPERHLVRHLGERLFGKRQRQEARNG